MPTEQGLLLAGLFLLLAAAGWAFGRFGDRETGGAPGAGKLSADYLRGLNFLLNEQTDQALELFLRMVRVDDQTIETHFALGSLFRRRGEVDRAIRIHQNIIARPDLPSAQRDQALFALAKDYLHAGLLDRAEGLFGELAERSAYREQALERLCGIYEQEHEWGQAIDAARRLERLRGRTLGVRVPHYYCELASAEIAAGDYGAARRHLKEAQSGRQRTLRGTLLRAEVAMRTDDAKTALRLYRRVMEEDPDLIVEVLPKALAAYRALGSGAELTRDLEQIVERRPEAASTIALTALLHPDVEDPFVARCLEQYILEEPTLAQFIDSQKIGDYEPEERASAMERIRNGLSRLAASTPRYRCLECGFSSMRLLWQCPSCKSWESQRPTGRVSFDALIQKPVHA